MTSTLSPTTSSIFLATGGARGITAQCVIRLAQEYQGHWILLGRSPLLAEEPHWAIDCLGEAELKKRIMQHQLAQGIKPTPKDIQAEFKAVMTRREILRTLNAIEQAGGTAAYLSVDVTDLAQLKAQVANIVQRWGPISGILHGAGNLADKLIERKTLEDFETVYAAKVQGLENLLRCIPAEQLQALVLFSSVAGFYGNAGQADYAIANEILNKSAHQLKRQYPNCHVVAINWGPWDSGMVTPELKKIYAEHNVEVIPVAAGTQLLAEELQPQNHDIAQVVIGNPLPFPATSFREELRTYQIRRRLALADNPFLLDHSIAGYPVLPATCAVAWMINACEQCYLGYSFLSCENFKIFKGIVFDQTLASEYILDLKEITKENAESVTFEAKIWSKTKAEKIHYHYMSQIKILRDLPAAPTCTALNLTPDSQIAVPASSFYQSEDSSLFHGPAFQGIERVINISPEGVTTQATWSTLAVKQQGQFPVQTVNPYIADLSMHGLWLWTQQFHQKACLPAEVKRFEQFAKIPVDQPFYVWTEIKAIAPASVTANFTICDAQGLTYARLVGATATLIQISLLRKQSESTRRIAALNSIGQDLSCAHLILTEEPCAKSLRSPYLEQTPFYLLTVAGRDQEDLLAQVETLTSAIETTNSLAKTAGQIFTEFQQRSHLPYAVAIMGHDREEMCREIQRAQTGIPKAFAQGSDWKTPLGSYFSPEPQGQRGGVAFVYPGAFTSYMGLTDSMNRLFPKVMDSLAIFNESQRMRQLMDIATREVYPRTHEKLTARQLEQLELKLQEDATTMLLFGTGAAVFFTTILREYFCLEPQAVFGYSLGEFSMMYALQVWTSSDTIAERLQSSSLFKTRLCGPKETVRQFWGDLLPLPSEKADFWGTYVLLSEPETVKACLAAEPKVYLTHINTPTEVVIAGEDEACRRIIHHLKCDYFPAPSKHVLHCEAMAAEFNELVDWFTLPAQPVPNVSFYTAARYGQTHLDSAAVAHNIAQSLCQPLDFPHLVRKVYEDGARIFIELGPGGTCSRWIRETLKQEEHTTVTFNTRGVDDHTATLRAIAKLVSHRVPLDLACLYEPAISESPAKIVPPIPQPLKVAAEATALNQSLFQCSPFRRKGDVAAAQQNSDERITAGNTSTATVTLPRPDSVPPIAPIALSSSLGRHQPHASFLEMRQQSLRQMSQLIESQMGVAKHLLRESKTLSPSLAPVLVPRHQQVILAEAPILEFAAGKLASVFGSDYSEVDTFPKRLRLPMPPYLFVSRVTQLDAQRGAFQPCCIETEYDIPTDAWYITHSQVPTAIFVEAYQSIILLLSYLGVDFEIRGECSFRALDGSITFLDQPPEAGETIRCHIQVNSFTRSGGTLLCFYDCHYFVGDRPFLHIKAGAGLFTEQTLKQSAGITLTKVERAARKITRKQPFTPLLHCPKVSFPEQDLFRLGIGNLIACFGEAYGKGQQQNPLLRLPASAFRMIDRVLAVNPKGGAWGLGMLVAEKDLHPEHWYFNCHFKDDS